MPKITRKTIKKQLHYDLIGKDSQRGITLTYGWLANQFGHLALGFIPTVLFYLMYITYFKSINAELWSPLTTAIMWTCFESYNFLGPLLKQAKTDTFQPDWKNVGFDTVTDLQYFYWGAFGAALVQSQCLSIQIPFYVLTIIVAILFKVWYPVKMYMQYAQFPFQFRISQWQHKIDDKDRDVILKMVKNKEPKHLLLFGDENSGKTSLAVGIATEFSIKRSISFYTTAMKCTKLFHNSDETLKKNYKLEWSWRQSKILVVDDIDAGGNNPDIILPSFFKDMNNESMYKQENIKALTSKSVIWVVGSLSNKQKWIDYITDLGVENNDIISIEL